MNSTKSLNYNGRNLYLGSLVETNPIIEEHILAHINIEEGNQDPWFIRFNSQIREMENFLDLTKNKKVLFDIGSQFGSFSFSFLGNSTDKKAYAFDGGINPFLVTTQIKMINNLNNFYNFNFLIGNKNEIVRCFSENLQSLAIPGNDTRLMFSIDMISQLYNIQPDVIKIDIEGSEYKALLGAKNTIIEYKPIIFIEIHPKFLIHYEDTIQDIVNFVDAIDYKVYDLQQNIVTNYLDILLKEETDSNRTVWMPN